MKRVLVLVGAIAIVLMGWAVSMLRGVPRASTPVVSPREAETSEPAVARQGARSRVKPWGARSVDPSNAVRALGEVVDSDGRPMTEAVLSLWCLHRDLTVTSLGPAIRVDDHGQFEGPGCRDRICVELHHPSATPQEPWILEPEQPQTLVATGAPEVQGVLLNEHGQPLAGIRVSALEPSEDADPAALMPVSVRTTTTDAAGRFAFPRVAMPPCGPCEEARDLCRDRTLDFHAQFRIVASPPGHAPGLVDVDLERGDGSDARPVVLRAMSTTARIRGTLTDPEGIPYQGAYVLARSLERSFEVRRSEVVDGRFELTSLGSGPYDLEALHAGHRLAEQAGVLPGEPVAWVGDRSATPSQVIVELRDTKGPIEGAEIEGPGPWARLRTDRDGRSAVVEALEGNYTLRIRPPRSNKPSRHVIAVGNGGDEARGVPQVVVVHLETRPDGSR